MLHPARLTRVATDHPDTLAALLCGILVLLGWSALQFNWLGLALFLLPAAYVIGGFESAREGLTTLFQEKELDVDLLMIVAALGAAFLGLWRREYYLIVDGAILILIFAISGALEGYAMQRTERSIRGLMSLTADTARVVVEFQSPCGELVVKGFGVLEPGEGCVELFQSPCGELVVKVEIFSLLSKNHKFQSPCGELVVKAS